MRRIDSIKEKVLTLQRKSFRAEVPYDRVVLRGGNNSNANSGLVYVNANNGCSNSNTNYGGRLNLQRLNNRVTLQGNVIADAFREGTEPRQPSQFIGIPINRRKLENDLTSKWWGVAHAASHR